MEFQEKQKNGIGITSLILAIVAIVSCWIPLLNVASIIIAIVSILLGIWSLLNVLRNKTKSLALPIFGIVLGVVSVIAAVYVNRRTFNESEKTSAKVGELSSLSKI